MFSHKLTQAKRPRWKAERIKYDLFRSFHSAEIDDSHMQISYRKIRFMLMKRWPEEIIANRVVVSFRYT